MEEVWSGVAVLDFTLKFKLILDPTLVNDFYCEFPHKLRRCPLRVGYCHGLKRVFFLLSILCFGGLGSQNKIWCVSLLVCI